MSDGLLHVVIGAVVLVAIGIERWFASRREWLVETRELAEAGASVRPRV